ncbi:MAG: class A beta-lactamase-related serine hydrolase [Sediminibacterium sp.]|nr:class A beta-lactamase-related serine hydrolase [Sediminibacterium sp.]
MQAQNINANSDSLLVALMKQNPNYFASLLADPGQYRIQILYTEINRDKNNVPHFKEYSYRLNANEYFYPASTVKFPLSVLALEKLNNLKVAGLNKGTTAIYDSVTARQETIYNNPYAIDGRQTIEQAIKEVLVVSDNNAANRLYEFLGQEYIHSQLANRGYPEVYIRNRLELGRTPLENRQTQTVQFYDANNKLIYTQPAQNNTGKLPYYNVLIGNGYLNSQDSLINAPLNFSEKNRISLSDLHHIMQSVIFPDQMPKKQQFNLCSDDRKFLLQWMHTTPKESSYPTYDSSEYYPAYAKFIMLGSERGTIPSNIKIFSKAGDAYGFLLDNTYIIDTEAKVEFMLSAVIYVNADGILNDNTYDYRTIGLPFMKNLGNTIYQYELSRKTAYRPNFDNIIGPSK